MNTRGLLISHLLTCSQLPLGEGRDFLGPLCYKCVQEDRGLHAYFLGRRQGAFITSTHLGPGTNRGSDCWLVRQKRGRPGRSIHGVTPAAAHEPLAHCDFGQEVGLSGPLAGPPAPLYHRTWTKVQLCLQLAAGCGAAHVTSLSFLVCKVGLVIPKFGGLQKSTCTKRRSRNAGFLAAPSHHPPLKQPRWDPAGHVSFFLTFSPPRPAL